MKLSIKKLITMALFIAVSSQTFAKNKPSNEDRPPNRPTFVSIDANEDGDIDFDEFSANELPHGDHQTVFDSMDSDNNGVISTEEYENHKPPQRGRGN
jgi:Ca2+-binding EF-hand superfamily protein